MVDDVSETWFERLHMVVDIDKYKKFDGDNITAEMYLRTYSEQRWPF